MPVPDSSSEAESNAHSDLGSELSVSIQNLHVRYKVYEDRLMSARQLVGGGFRSRTSTEIHAINDVTLDIKIGEPTGIVGANGSGKSTLLRAIAGLQSKSGGMIKVRGEAHLLGVGAALKPMLSGFRNVMLGGLAMGIPRADIEAQMDDVVEFSGIGDAIARPMNTYSSGMRARLAFSIAMLRVPDILLIDEALAVGDKEFRKRSLARVREIQAEASTVIMVTHNLNEIRQTCTRAVWLDHGKIVADGPVEETLASYEGR